jgi:hypothetical protein
MKIGDILYIITMAIAISLCFLWDVLLSTVGKDKVSEMRRNMIK